MHRTPGRTQRSPGFSPGYGPGPRASPRGWEPGHGGGYGGSPRFTSPGSGAGGRSCGTGVPCFSPPGFRGSPRCSPRGCGAPYPGFGAGASGFRGRRWEEPRRGAFSPGHGARNQGNDSVEKYFSPNMVQDPWKNLTPVSKDQVQTGTRPGRTQD